MNNCICKNPLKSCPVHCPACGLLRTECPAQQKFSCGPGLHDTLEEAVRCGNHKSPYKLRGKSHVGERWENDFEEKVLEILLDIRDLLTPPSKDVLNNIILEELKRD